MRQLNVINIACTAWVWPPYGYFLSFFWTKIYITTGEYIFLISISNLTLLALTLMFVSESYNAIESQIYQELPHLELKRCMNCKYLILQLNVSFWVIWQETRWFSLGYIQVCFSSPKVWKCYVYFVDCWTTMRSITFHTGWND